MGRHQDKKNRLPNPQETTSSNDNIMVCQTRKTEKITKGTKNCVQRNREKVAEVENKQQRKTNTTSESKDTTNI